MDGETVGATAPLKSTTQQSRPKRNVQRPKRYEDGWNPELERAKRKFLRRKNVVSRLVNSGNDIIRSKSSRTTLRGLVNKLENALKELDDTGEEYSLYLDGEELIEHLDCVEIMTDGVNYCLEKVIITCPTYSHKLWQTLRL